MKVEVINQIIYNYLIYNKLILIDGKLNTKNRIVINWLQKILN